MVWQPIRLFKRGDIESPLIDAGYAYAKKLIGFIDSLSKFQGIPPNNIIQRTIPGLGVVVRVVRTPGIDNVYVTVPPTITPVIELPTVEIEQFPEPGMPLLFCGGNQMAIVTYEWNEEYSDTPTPIVGEWYSSGGTAAETMYVFSYEGEPAIVGEFDSNWVVGGTFLCDADGGGYTTCTITGIYGCVFDLTYEVANITSSANETEFNVAEVSALVSGPIDMANAAHINTTGCMRSWSKTWDKLTLTAYLSGDASDLRWGVCATWDGEHIPIGGQAFFGNFHRYKESSYSIVPDACFIGFDADEDGHRIYLMSDDGDFYTFLRTDGVQAFVLETHNRTTIQDHDEYVSGKTRLAGLRWNTAIWVVFGGGFYFEERFPVGEVGDSAVTGHAVPSVDSTGVTDALWNHVLRELYLVYNIDGETDPIVGWQYTDPEFLCAYDRWFRPVDCYPGLGDPGLCPFEWGCHIAFSNNYPVSVDYDAFAGTDMYGHPLYYPISFFPSYPGWTSDYLTHTKFYAWQLREGDVTDMGYLVTGDTQWHKGTLYEPDVAGRISYDVTPSQYPYVSPTGAVYYTGKTIPGGYNYRFSDWIFDINGIGWSGHVQHAHWEEDGLSVVADNWTDQVVGDGLVAASAEGGYPWDLGWKAILYNGQDVCGNTVKVPAVAYTSGFIKVSDDTGVADYFRPAGCEKSRQFFMRHVVQTIQCTEGADE